MGKSGETAPQATVSVSRRDDSALASTSAAASSGGGGGSSSSSTSSNAAVVEEEELSVTRSLHVRRDWYCSIATFVAGGVAGAASRTLTAPLDRIKLIVQEGHLVQAPQAAATAAGAAAPASVQGATGTAAAASATQAVRRTHPSLVQVARVIKADGGWKAFWRGNTINCFKAGPEFAIVFSIRRYLSSLYEDCVEREKKRRKHSAARWHEKEERSAAISLREEEERVSMMVGRATADSGKGAAPSTSSSTAALSTEEVRLRERAISLEASILTPPFNRLGCISNVPQLAVNCTIGAAAGLGAQGLLYPLEVVKTRVVVSRSSEYRGGVKEIVRLAYKKGGIMEFYRGFAPNMVGIVVYRGLEMGLYSSAQQSIMMYRMQVMKMNRHEASLGSAEVGAVGMFSSTVAQTVSYPLNVIRTRLQTQGTNGRAKKYTGMVDCMVKMIKNKGVSSLFSGLMANYLKAAPASGCTFVVFEWVQRILIDDD